MIRIQGILVVCLLSLAACKTPNYVEKGPTSNSSVEIPFTSEVVYTISDNYQDEGIGCIAVSKFSLEHEDAGYSDFEQADIIRKSVYGVLSAKSYRSVELSRVDYKADELSPSSDTALLQTLDCDALLKGQILGFKNDYFITYSVTTVELQLTLLNRSGSQLWTARHAASSHEGAMPLSPLSLLSGIFTATTNKQDEVAFQMVDAVARRLLNTLPDSSERRFAEDSIGSLIDENVVSEDVSIGSTEVVESQLTSIQLLAKGAYEEALSAAKAEIQNDPSNGEAYLVAGRASLLLSDHNAAIDYSLSALAKGEQSSSAYSGLGIAYLKNENMRLAKASFKKAAELDPSNYQAQFNLALVSEVEGKASTASNYYAQAGTLALEAKELPRVHKALTALKRLSLNNVTAQNRYSELGQKVQSLLDN